MAPTEAGRQSQGSCGRDKRAPGNARSLPDMHLPQLCHPCPVLPTRAPSLGPLQLDFGPRGLEAEEGEGAHEGSPSSSH